MRVENHTRMTLVRVSRAGMFRSPEFLETYRSFRNNYIVSFMVQSIMNIVAQCIRYMSGLGSALIISNKINNK